LYLHKSNTSPTLTHNPSTFKYPQIKTSKLLYLIPYTMLISYCFCGSLTEHFAIFPGCLALPLSHSPFLHALDS
jgi:hypothetical protein